VAEDHLPVHYQAQTPVKRPTSPVHEAGELRFGTMAATREELWGQLTPALREKVNQRMGRRLEWWASQYDGRINAVVLGTQALIVLDPTVNDAGRPATEIKTIRLDEASLRSARVTGPGATPSSAHQAQPNPAAPAAGHSQPGDPPAAPVSELTLRLGPDISGFLGQLPPRAQQLMQEPFLTTPYALVCDNYYVRRGDSHSINGATLDVWGYVTDYRTLTFCAGVGHRYREPAGPSTWELTCWRLKVAPRSAQ
jgi:hypothetical protein